MELKQLVNEENAYWVEYKDGVRLLIHPITPIEFRRLLKQCTVITNNGANKIDEEKLTDEVLKCILKGWDGLTPKIINHWHSGLLKVASDEPVEFSLENAKFLCDYVWGFDTFLKQKCLDIAMQKQQEQEKLEDNFFITPSNK